MKKELYVIAHGHKAHSVHSMGHGGWHTDCGLIIPQMRPALTRDKRCKNCLKELAALKRIRRLLPPNPSSALTKEDIQEMTRHGNYLPSAFTKKESRLYEDMHHRQLRLIRADCAGLADLKDSLVITLYAEYSQENACANWLNWTKSTAIPFVTWCFESPLTRALKCPF